MKLTSLFFALSTLLSGCAHSDFPSRHSQDMNALIGKRITLEGVAEPRQLGAALRGDDFFVWIDGLADWPSHYIGHRIKVIGILEVRHDLPVFIPKLDEPLTQHGMPVPEGINLHEASFRFVIRNASWTLLK